MRGALTSIISLTTILWIGGNAVAQNALEADKGPLSLEKSFEVANKRCKINCSMRRKPLTFISPTGLIFIINRSLQKIFFRSKEKLTLHQRRPGIMRSQKNKRSGSPMDFQLCRPNGVIWPLSCLLYTSPSPRDRG